jgi:uncharacterized protein YcnI
MSKKLFVVAAVAAAALALAGIASAHVTIHPNALPSGGYTVINVRVPNERETTNTTKVAVSFPPGFYSVSYKPLPGWSTKILYRKLAKPVAVEGGTVKQEVDEVIFSGTLPPHTFAEFPLSVAVPSVKAGTVLTFKALQTYSNGEIVRWIGPPGADEPAPQVMVTAAKSPLQDYPGGVSAMKKMRMTASASKTERGVLFALPLVGLLGAGALARRRQSN